MMVLAVDNNADWEHCVIEPMGGDTEEIAIMALRHLRDDFSRWTEWDHTWVLTHVRLLSNISFCKRICVATLSQKSIRPVTETIISLVNNSDLSAVHTSYPRSSCLPYCCLYLGRFLDEYGANTIIQAIQAGIIPALLQTGPWTRLEDQSLAGYTLGLISDVIPRYMLYRLVLRALAKSFEDIRALGLEAKMAKSGRLWETWSRFKALFEERWEIQMGLEEFFSKSHKSCHNKEVRLLTAQSVVVWLINLVFNSVKRLMSRTNTRPVLDAWRHTIAVQIVKSTIGFVLQTFLLQYDTDLPIEKIQP